LLSAKEEFAGRQAPCPGCNTVHTIPNPAKPPQPAEEEFDAEAVEEQEPEEEILDVLPVNVPAGPKPTGITIKHVGRKEKSDSPEPIVTDRPPPRRPRPSRRRRRRPIIYDDDEGRTTLGLEPGWFGSTNAGLVGGFIMLGIGFVVLIAGLAFGWLLFIAPFLMVVGIVAIINGIKDQVQS
jgi:hypothetical protein